MPPGAELTRLLAELEPAEQALWDWVRTRMNGAIVREMAELDYGMRVDEHRQGIEDLVATRRPPQELPWAPPRPVLELSSHAEPADPRPRPGSAGWRTHIARLFSALVLIRAAEPTSPAGVLAGLVESAVQLGPEVAGPALRTLAWCRLHEPGGWRDEPGALPFLTLGVLLLSVAAPGTAADPAVTAGLARAFVAEVRALPPDRWWPGDGPTVLLKSIAGASSWRTWRRLVDRYLIDGAAADDSLAQLGRIIADPAGVSIAALRTWARTHPAPGAR